MSLDSGESQLHVGVLGYQRESRKDQLFGCCHLIGENSYRLIVVFPTEEEEGRLWTIEHVRSYGKLLLGFFGAKRTILHSNLSQGVAKKMIAGWVACGDDTAADKLSARLKGESC